MHLLCMHEGNEEDGAAWNQSRWDEDVQRLDWLSVSVEQQEIVDER